MAAAADALQLAFPPATIPIGIITALIFFSLWGWRWEILCVLIPDLAPMVGILPTWLAIATYLTIRGQAMKPVAQIDTIDPTSSPSIRNVTTSSHNSAQKPD